jgi:hypothetical protein
MKKFSILIALVLLAVAGTGYAVTCAYDNVPAATLLVPYWKVTCNVTPCAFPIPSGGTDTLVSVVNVSAPGLIAHVTVWNKYSAPVIDFNIPLTGKDVVSFSMRDIMNGKLSPNLPQYDLTDYPKDPCGITGAGGPIASVGYTPSIGFGRTQFIRFSHPEAAAKGNDFLTSISQYNHGAVYDQNGVCTNASTPGVVCDAIGFSFRPAVWNSLDESGDITTFTTSAGANILDRDNPACNWGPATPTTNALSGYLTIDVVNYCTNFFPDGGNFYVKDAIATAGWTQPLGIHPDFCPNPAVECALNFTPNALIGDVFYVDSNTVGGNVSGDPAVAIEFDSRLAYTPLTKTFFGKFVTVNTPGLCGGLETTATGCTQFINTYAAAFEFPGDGREPLGDRYGFRYLADSVNGLQSWLTVWRSDLYLDPVGKVLFNQVNLCSWADPGATKNRGASGSGFYDTPHQVQVLTYDNDENLFAGVGVKPGPSGPPPGTSLPNYIFLESQRISLQAGTTDWNPQAFVGGWIDLTLRNPAALTGADASHGLYNMGWVGVQHTAPGQFISVGYSAANLNNQFQCSPNPTAAGTRVDGGFGTWPVFP